MADKDAGSKAAPSKATAAVLLPSDPVPDGVQKVQGLDFNAHHAADITVAELVDGMANMGFQASAVAEAVQIINQMVRPPWIADPVCPPLKCSSDCSAARLDRSRNWRKDDHLSRLHIQPNFLWAT